MKVYLSGEIHTSWREDIIAACEGLDLAFTAPVTDHGASNNYNITIISAKPNKF